MNETVTPGQEACWATGDGMTDAELYARYESGWRAYRRPASLTGAA